MVDSKQNMKKYFLPIYWIWAFLSPSLILLVNNIPSEKIPAFYALFGLIWPLTFVVYPAFYLSFTQNNAEFLILSLNLAIPMFFIAWLGPIVHLVTAIIYHRKYIISTLEEDKELSWGTYFLGFI